MSTSEIDETQQSYWFVGSVWGRDHQTQRFLDEGIWEHGYEDRYFELVRSMRPGEKIAIKAVFSRKYGLNFNNRGISVGGMKIKAVGVIVKNPKDGKRVRVNWTELDPPREWYFHTPAFKAVHRVTAGE